ncbi:MAG: hypothetical protein IIW10_02270, partial [Spirochaetaceae bacterium]|nr:hypothetical protein [Spirochaetaceae bacterium]
TRFTKGGEYRVVGAKMLLGLLFSLRGTTFVYQGQEIGMTNGAFNSLDEIMDIESHNVDKMAKRLGIFQPFRWKMIKATTRDNARTPMQWSEKDGAGFTSGKPWLKFNPNYKEVNVAADSASPTGVIAFFKKINAFKKASAVLKDGSFTSLAETKDLYAFRREYNGEKLVVLCNFKTGITKLPSSVVAEISGGETALSNYENTAAIAPLKAYEFRLVKVAK